MLAAPFPVVTIVASFIKGCVGGGVGGIFGIGGIVVGGVICGIVVSGRGVIPSGKEGCVMSILGKQDVLCPRSSKSPCT